MATSDDTPASALLPVATGAIVIPTHNVHRDEDQFYAGGESVDNSTPDNVPNGVFNAIIFPDINISHVIY